MNKNEPPPTADAAGLFEQALMLHNQGRLEEAAKFYGAAIARDPSFAAAHGNLGAIYRDLRRPEEALACFERALKLDPNNADVHYNLGTALSDLNRFAEALSSFDRALALNPDTADAYNNRGNILRALHRSADALASYERARALDPNFAEAHNNCGVVLQTLGDIEEAIHCYARAIALNPAYAEAHLNLGSALLTHKRPAEALASEGRALSLRPDWPEALNNRGNAFRALGRAGDALLDYDRALRFSPRYVDVYNNRGNALRDLKRYDEALASFERALELAPQSTDALNNRGNALRELRRCIEAIASYDAALRLDPDLSVAHNNRGSALMDLGRHPEALESFDNALRRKPNDHDALANRGYALVELKRHAEAADAFSRLIGVSPEYKFAPGYLFHARAHDCDWHDYEAARARLLAGIGRGEYCDMPFSCLTYAGHPALQFKCGRLYAGHRHALPPVTLRPEKPYKHDRIRIAYLSGDFRSHPVAIQLVGVWERHDKTRFETFGISFGPTDNSDLHTRLVAAFDQFLDVRDKSDFEIAKLLREYEIDIAVDLMGYTNGCRPDILSFRPAPIQVSYLGYPGTMGTDFIDYLLADKILVPEENQEFYAENIASLPHSFMATDSSRRIAKDKPSRAESGLPESGFVFCCFNNLYKLTPEIFDIWMRLLGAVKDSVLWLPSSNPAAMKNLRNEAETRGISSDRLVFAPFVPSPEAHLARMRLADLFLDTLPYNAHASASDALWAGLPVLTCTGSSFASRVAASLLNAVGLFELVTDKLTDYESLALKLATTPGLLADIKAKLARNRLTHPLFDTDLFRRHLEAAYIAMHERHQRGDPPTSFAIPDR